MLRRVQQYIRDHQLLSLQDKVLVCVSGGADSVALLDVLHRGGYECIVAHCNFNLRKQESDRDEQFVRLLVDEYNKTSVQTPVKLFVKHFDTISYAKANHISIEMAARDLRYSWFDQLALEQQCCAIAVAHHQNDQAETLLLNLKRGTGLRGLAGMRPKSNGWNRDMDNQHSKSHTPIIRPLLCTTRDYILHYLRDIRHLQWVEDSTNSDTSFQRNAIRQQLATYTKAEIQHMAQTASRVQGYIDMLNAVDSQEAQMVRLYEELREYNFPEIEKMFYAQKRGEGGKIFYADYYTATLKKGQWIIQPREPKN